MIFSLTFYVDFWGCFLIGVVLRGEERNIEGNSITGEGGAISSRTVHPYGGPDLFLKVVNVSKDKTYTVSLTLKTVELK
jgi:hypothetical protein